MYLPIYLKQRGITPNEAGVIYGIIPFIGFLSQVVFSIVADKVNKYRLMMMVFLAVGLGAYMLLLLMPQRPMKTKYVEASMFVHDNITCLNISSDIQNEKYDNSDVCETSILQLFHRFSRQQIRMNCQETCSLLYTENNTIFQYSENEYSDNKSFVTSMVNVTFDGMRKVLSYEQEGLTFSKNQTCIHHQSNTATYLISKHSNFSTNFVNVFCKLSCHNYKLGGCGLTEYTYDWIFGIFLLLLSIVNACSYPIGSMLDGATFRTLGKDKHLYGRQRVFSIFGMTSMSLIFGLTMDASSTDQSHINYDISFYVSAAIAVLTMIAFTTLKVPPVVELSTKTDSGVMHLFCKMKSLLFFLIVFWCGITSGCANFLFWFLKDIGSTQTTIAMCIVVRSVAGVVCLFLSGKIVDKIGTITCIYFALIGYVIRLTVISVVTNPWYVLPSETLSGITENLMWAASSIHASSMVKEHSAATIQGIVGGTYFGAGTQILVSYHVYYV